MVRFLERKFKKRSLTHTILPASRCVRHCLLHDTRLLASKRGGGFGFSLPAITLITLELIIMAILSKVTGLFRISSSQFAHLLYWNDLLNHFWVSSPLQTTSFERSKTPCKHHRRQNFGPGICLQKLLWYRELWMLLPRVLFLQSWIGRTEIGNLLFSIMCLSIWTISIDCVNIYFILRTCWSCC